MKTLYLMRHAKSSWDNVALNDIERPIIEKGIKRTQKMIKWMHVKGLHADCIISSPAVRAFDTAKLIAEALNYPSEKIVLEKAIYYGTTENLFDVIYAISDHLKEVFLFGHNPNITQFANYFLENKIDYLPTSGLVGIEFDTDKWSSIPACKWKERYVTYPKMLK